MVGFELDGNRTSELVWPAASGIVLTTGNMPDAHEYTGSSTTAKEAHLRGPTFVGPTADQPHLHYLDPLLLSGYVTGEVVHREAPKVATMYRSPEDFVAPFSWYIVTFSSCNQLPGVTGDG